MRNQRHGVAKSPVDIVKDEEERLAVLKLPREASVFTEIVNDADTVACDGRNADYSRREPDFELEAVDGKGGKTTPYGSVYVLGGGRSR